MYKMKAPDGTNNLCGNNLRYLRENYQPSLSQRKLASMLQVSGYDVDHHFIRRVELGERFVTDIELLMLSKFFHISIDALVNSHLEKDGNV